MKEIRITKGLSTLVDDEDYEELSKYNWFYTNGYAGRRTGGSRTRTVHTTMHRVITKCPKGFQVDHINGDKLDNRRSNLRIVTRSQNKMNQGALSNNTSGFKGVSRNNHNRNWRAVLSIGGKKTYLGGFKNARHAALVYDLWAKEIYGEYAKLNFPRAV